MESLSFDNIWQFSCTACGIFTKEFLKANNRFSYDKSFATLNKLVVEGGLFMLLISFLSIFASFVISRRKKSWILICLAELSAFAMVGLAWFVPFRFVRYFLAIVVFTQGLSIHSRICSMIYEKCEKDSTSESRSFLHEMFNTLNCNVLQRIHHFQTPRLPPMSRILYWLTVMLLADFTMYLVKEWIPIHINVSNQLLASSVVGGVWVLYSMDIFYCGIISTFDIYGAPLPLEMKHRHPLLSASLSEFWGVRWNPIVGKLLQDSFYKPLRRIKTSRIVCMIVCFSGSALLHAVPQFISTRDWMDCYMMFGFFFLQGVFLTLELIVLRLLNWKKEDPKPVSTVTPVSSSCDLQAMNATSSFTLNTVSNNCDSNATCSTSSDANRGAKPGKLSVGSLQSQFKTVQARHTLAEAHNLACKSAPYQFPTEICVVSVVISTLYYLLIVVLEDSSSNNSSSSISASSDLTYVPAAIAVTSGVIGLTCYYQVRLSIERSVAAATTTASVDNYLENSKHQAMKSKSKKQSSAAAVTTTLSFSAYAFTALGWIWSVGSIILVLPLFSIPMLHACEDVYTQSFVVGSVVRTIIKLLEQ